MLSENENFVIEQAKSILLKHLNTQPVMENFSYVKTFCRLKLAMYEHEVFSVMFLDNRHRLIEFVEISRGTINASVVYPREVAKKALLLNAGAVILTHNHPSSYLEPSEADKAITNKLSKVLSLFDIRVLDHILVGVNGEISFAERGLL